MTRLTGSPQHVVRLTGSPQHVVRLTGSPQQDEINSFYTMVHKAYRAAILVLHNGTL